MTPLFPQSGTIPSMTNQLPFNGQYQINQVPGMSINFPSLLQSQQNSTPNPVLVGVHGLDSVKQFPFKPNQTLAFHDLDADFEYVVNTDVNNQPAFKILEFNEISEEEYREKYSKAVKPDNVVLTSEEYDALLKRVEKLEKEVNVNAQQPVRFAHSNADKSVNAATKSAARPANTRNVSEIESQQQS